MCVGSNPQESYENLAEEMHVRIVEGSVVSASRTFWRRSALALEDLEAVELLPRLYTMKSIDVTVLYTMRALPRSVAMKSDGVIARDAGKLI